MPQFRKAARSPNQLPDQPIVAVVGLQKAQFADLVVRCDNAIKLKFVNVEQSECILPRADVVVLVTKFISHRWTDVALRKFPRRRVIFHGGGISLLAERLLSLAATAIQS